MCVFQSRTGRISETVIDILMKTDITQVVADD